MRWRVAPAPSQRLKYFQHPVGVQRQQYHDRVPRTGDIRATETTDGVTIDVRVTPRSSRSGFAGVRDGALLVRLHAPPVDGAANAELVDLLAKLLEVPRNALTILAGNRNRRKRVRVHGVSVTHIRATLDAHDAR